MAENNQNNFEDEKAIVILKVYNGPGLNRSLCLNKYPEPDPNSEGQGFDRAVITKGDGWTMQ